MTLILDDFAVLREGKPLANVSATVAPGEALSVMGPSGVGKSSLLNGLAGLLPPRFSVAGSARLDGVDLLSRPPEQRRLGVMFQDALLYPHLTVLQNVAFAIPRRGAEGVRGRAARRAAAAEGLARVGLEALGGRDPDTLSGGQRSRVALARTLAGRPRALLLDEPFSALDQRLRGKVRDVVFGLARQDGLPIVLVSHDPEDAKAAGGRVIEIRTLPDGAGAVT
ncbi:MAG: ATP-binding cassette domain-containing protein [Pseudomonadota bacterium]